MVIVCCVVDLLLIAVVTLDCGWRGRFGCVLTLLFVYMVRTCCVWLWVLFGVGFCLFSTGLVWMLVSA